jgi:hypothetical protein
MKKLAVLLATLATLGMVTGCRTPAPAPVPDTLIGWGLIFDSEESAAVDTLLTPQPSGQ